MAIGYSRLEIEPHHCKLLNIHLFVQFYEVVTNKIIILDSLFMNLLTLLENPNDSEIQNFVPTENRIHEHFVNFVLQLYMICTIIMIEILNINY